MVKIVILVRILWTAGAQKIAINEAKTLQSMGHEVKLVFLRSTESAKYLESELKGVNFEIFAEDGYHSKWIYSKVTGKFMAEREGEGTVDYDLIKKFSKSIKRDDADYIICHDQWAGIAGLLTKKKLGIPYSVMIHEHVNEDYTIPILGWFAKRTETSVLKNANAIFGITEKVSNSVRSLYGLNSEPNYPGMNHLKWVNYGEKRDILLASATWDKDRDPRMYLDIVERLPEYKLYVAGRWRANDEKMKFEKDLETRGLKDQVVLTGEISEEELQDLYIYSKFNLRFNLEPEWGLGTSNVESISRLTPIIVNSQLGISDLIWKHGGGKVLKGIDVSEAVAFIKENENERKYSTLQSQLKELTEIYTWENHCKKLLLDLI